MPKDTRLSWYEGWTLKRQQRERKRLRAAEAKHRREFGHSYERFCRNGHGFFAKPDTPCPVCGMALNMVNRMFYG